MGGSETDAFLMRLQGVVRETESRSLAGSIVVNDGFADRVMAAIATEPMPRGSILAGVTGALHGVLAPFGAIAEAWRVSMTRGRPLVLRVQAFALILALAFAVGSAGALAAIGAGRWLAADRRDGPAVIPGPTPPTTEGILPAIATPTPTPASEPVATDAPTPSVAPSPTGRPGTTTGAAPATHPPAPHIRTVPAPAERPDGSEHDDGSRETDQPDAPDEHSGDGSSSSPDGHGPDSGTSDPTGSDAGG